MHITTNWDSAIQLQNKVAYVSSEPEEILVNELEHQFSVKHVLTFNAFEDYLSEQSILTLPDILLMEIDEEEYCFTLVEKIKKNPMLAGLLIVLLAKKHNNGWKSKARSARRR